jgi:hypothetical protein
MHVLYENITKQLLKLWEGDYKLKVINGDAAQKLVRSYVISAANWTRIDTDTVRSTMMVPAQMAPYVKSVTKRSTWNADCYSYFLMHLGPIVLRDRLDNVYYHISLTCPSLQSWSPNRRLPKKRWKIWRRGLSLGLCSLKSKQQTQIFTSRR